MDQILLVILYQHRYIVCILTGRDRRGRDRMVVGFTTTYAISTL
jgi:hypothetical protein